MHETDFRGIVAALLVTAILGWISVANATPTLEITGGSVGGSQLISCLDGGANVSGANFTFFGSTLSTFCPGDFVTTVRVLGTLTLNGVVFQPPCLLTGSCVDNTTLVFTNAPFPEPPILALFAYHGPYQTTFTMTGHTDVGPPGGVDFVGQGIVTLGLRFTDESHQSAVIFETYDFRVPETPTLALLAGAVLIILAARRRRRCQSGR